MIQSYDSIHTCKPTTWIPCVLVVPHDKLNPNYLIQLCITSYEFTLPTFHKYEQLATEKVLSVVETSKIMLLIFQSEPSSILAPQMETKSMALEFIN